MHRHKANNQARKNEILNGNILKGMILFALPLAISSILQQLFSAVDMAVVGIFATSRDQAAVGCNSALINLLLNLFIGIAVGANVVIGTYVGQEREAKIKDAVHTAIPVAIISGLILILIGFPISEPVLRLMNTPEDTLPLAVRYLRIYLVGMPFIMLYNFGAAILRSVGDSKRPMYILTVSGIINAILNVILVAFFNMGVAGVAIATVVANIVSSSTVIYILCHENSAIRLDLKQIKIHPTDLIRMLRIGMPSGLQGMVFSLANIFIQSTLNGFGSIAVAGSAAAINTEYVSYFVVNAFNQAVMTFISQNYGAHNFDRCKKVFRTGLACAVVSALVVSYSFAIFRYQFMGLFTSNPEVIEYGAIRILTIMPFYIILTTYEIPGSALRGLGKSLIPAIITVFGTCVIRLLYIYTIFPLLGTYQMLFIVYPISWTITGTLVMTAYIITTRKIYAKPDGYDYLLE